MVHLVIIGDGGNTAAIMRQLRSVALGWYPLSPTSAFIVSSQPPRALRDWLSANGVKVVSVVQASAQWATSENDELHAWLKAIQEAGYFA